ncbi:MAG: glycosyltransferase family 87 protein, partial [Gemmataceae bacterium]
MAAALVLLLVGGVVFCRRQDSEWEQVYVAAAARLWHGQDLYRFGDNYLYPPFMACTALPFLALPQPLTRLVWFLINVCCLLVLLRWSWRLAGGGRLQGYPPAPPRERLAALLGCLCGLFYVQNCLAHQQTDLVIAVLLLGGIVLWRRGRPLSAATSFGLAAASKCTG